MLDRCMIEKARDERTFRMADSGHISVFNELLNTVGHERHLRTYFRLRQRLQDSCGLSLRRLDGGRGDDAGGEDAMLSM